MTTSQERLSALVAELGQVLDEERAALLGGSPERIAAAAARKLALADSLEAEAAAPGAFVPNPVALARIARRNRENGMICAAMLRHMTRAIDKLRRHEPHRSYRPDGTERDPPARHSLGAA